MIQHKHELRVDLDAMHCLLDFWAEDPKAQQLEKTHTNHEVFKMFSKWLKDRRFDWCHFWPVNGMTAPTWLLLICFDSLEILLVWNQTEPKGKCKWVTTHPLIRTTWTELQGVFFMTKCQYPAHLCFFRLLQKVLIVKQSLALPSMKGMLKFRFSYLGYNLS